MSKFYTGTITKVLDSVLKTVEVESPGIFEGVTAYPKSSGIDEPKVGDPVLILSLDEVLNSYFIYEKLKESDFIGFRSNGKMVSIDNDSLDIVVFDEALKDDSSIPTESNVKARIRISKDGDIDIQASGEINVSSMPGKTISFSTGNQVQPGSVIPNPIGGGFSCLKQCPYIGAPHVGNNITGIGGKL